MGHWVRGNRTTGRSCARVRVRRIDPQLGEGPGLNADFTMAVRNAANDVRAEEQRCSPSMSSAERWCWTSWKFSCDACDLLVCLVGRLHAMVCLRYRNATGDDNQIAIADL